MDPKSRCAWAGTDPLYVAYHDEEWGVPVHDDIRMFEFLVLEGAQAGLSWSTILRKRHNYRLAFDGFNPLSDVNDQSAKSETWPKLMLMISRPGKYQIVLAAFGTSRESSAPYADIQRRFEERFKQKIPLGFTSRVGEPKLTTVLENLAAGDETNVVVTPLFMISGRVVSQDVAAAVRAYEHRFRKVFVAEALLPDERIYEVVQKELASRLKNVKHGETGIVFVGHGTPDPQAALIYTECARRIATLFAPTVRTAFGNLESSAPFLGERLGISS